MLNVLLALRELQEDVMLVLQGHNVEVLDDDEPFNEKVSRSNYDLVMIEGKTELVSAVKTADPRAEVILFGYNRTDAIDAIKKGASAYFPYPVELPKLKETIDEIHEMFIKRRETEELENLLTTKYKFAGIIGKNPQILEIFSYIRRIAPYFRTVTIMGETGTGKEVIARALHSISPTSKHPFVAINCGAFSENLIQSELFGHKKGSFTGAIADKPGLFSVAGDGTIFLDEIAEIPLPAQSLLLRVLQDGEFRSIGSTQIARARCRVIAATNKDLLSEMKKGTFREDLYYRITPLTVYVPPLRERKDDIPLLCRYFLEKFNQRTGKKVFGISRPAQTALFAYDWPGNVRKLENVIEQAAIMTATSFIRLDDLPEYLRETHSHKTLEPAGIDDIIKKHIKETLDKCAGNRSKAATMLGISRRALLRKIEKYSLT